jgi:hypothetical protein
MLETDCEVVLSPFSDAAERAVELLGFHGEAAARSDRMADVRYAQEEEEEQDALDASSTDVR